MESSAGSEDVEIASESALENHTPLKKNDVERLTHTVENLLQLPMDSRGGPTVSLSPMTRIS